MAAPMPPPAQPPTSPWPPGWSPTWAPRPPPRVNWLTLLGGILVFFGYLLFAAADFALATLPFSATYGQVLAVYLIAVVGEVIVGSGFLLAFYSLAVRRD